MRSRGKAGLGALSLAGGLAFATLPCGAQDWVRFEDETATRVVAAPEVSTTDPEEKDYAVGDLDQDCRDDLVVVRKLPHSFPGGRRNVLFMNEAGVLVDRSAELAPAFLDATDDRDVQFADFDGDGWLDVVTAGTFGEPSRVLMNLGRDRSGTWLGLAYDPGRIPAFAIPPKFCSVAAGDVTGDGYPDLYFANYSISLADSQQPQLEDRLLINDGRGFFSDQTESRLSFEMYDSDFATSALIGDWNMDGVNEILKVNSSGNWGSRSNAAIFYQDGEGFFDYRDEIYPHAPYMSATADFTGDGRLDLIFVDDAQDRYLVNRANDEEGRADFQSGYFNPSVRTTGFGGSAHLADFDGDGILDAIVADADADTTANPNRRLGIVRGYEPTVENQTRFRDPIESVLPWMHHETYDAVGMQVDDDGVLDLVVGALGGMYVYRGTGSEPPPRIFSNGFEFSTTACWSWAAP